MPNNHDIERLFKEGYPRMFSLAFALLKDEQDAHDAVHDVFADLLQSGIYAGKGLGYLLRCVRNRCLNALKAKPVRESITRLLLTEEGASQFLSQTRDPQNHGESPISQEFLSAGESPISQEILSTGQSPINQEFLSAGETPISQEFLSAGETPISQEFLSAGESPIASDMALVITPEAEDEMEDLLRQVRDIIHNRLPAQCSRVMRMRYEEGLPYLEIGKRLGISRISVYKHLRHGLDHLRKSLSSR